MICNPCEVFYASPVTDRWIKPKTGARLIDPGTIINIVCKYFSVSIKDLKTKGRKREFSIPRQICMFFMTEETNLTLKAIGNIFGGRDHTTVIHSCNSIKDIMETDNKILSIINSISRDVGRSDDFRMPDKRYRIRKTEPFPTPQPEQQAFSRPPAVYSNYKANSYGNPYL